MSNSTRTTLRTRVQRLLNAVNDSFWSTAILNELLQTSFDKYFREWSNLNDRFGVREFTMTYGAALDKDVVCNGKLLVDATTGFYVGEGITGGSSAATGIIYKVSSTYMWLKTVTGTFTAAETVTGGTSSATATVGTGALVDILGENIPEICRIKACMLKLTTSSEYIELVEAPYLTEMLRGSYDSYTQDPDYFYFNKEITSVSDMSGAALEVPVLYLRPVPTSSVTLRLHIQVEPHALSADTSSTGLPDFVEACLVYEAAIQARTIEENTSQISILSNLLAEAERKMYKLANRYVSGGDELILRDWDL